MGSFGWRGLISLPFKLNFPSRKQTNVHTNFGRSVLRFVPLSVPWLFSKLRGHDLFIPAVLGSGMVMAATTFPTLRMLLLYQSSQSSTKSLLASFHFFILQNLERAFAAGQFVNYQIQVDAERYVMLMPDGNHLQFR